jgi:crossover junction endodeoxyribonuclease RuvC
VGISPREFEAMQARVNGAPDAALPEVAASTRIAPGTVVIGVDPSLRGTGYGVIRLGAPVHETLSHGTIKCHRTWERSRCLAEIASTMRRLMTDWQPAICVVEGLFHAQNVKTAIIMGEARGAAIGALAENGIEVYEIAARKVKQAIVGYGAAQKLAVAKMVQRMLALNELPDPDAADALALALAHTLERSGAGLSRPNRI